MILDDDSRIFREDVRVPAYLMGFGHDTANTILTSCVDKTREVLRASPVFVVSDDELDVVYCAGKKPEREATSIKL